MIVALLSYSPPSPAPPAPSPPNWPPFTREVNPAHGATVGGTQRLAELGEALRVGWEVGSGDIRLYNFLRELLSDRARTPRYTHESWSGSALAQTLLKVCEGDLLGSTLTAYAWWRAAVPLGALVFPLPLQQ